MQRSLCAVVAAAGVQKNHVAGALLHGSLSCSFLLSPVPHLAGWIWWGKKGLLSSDPPHTWTCAWVTNPSYCFLLSCLNTTEASLRLQQRRLTGAFQHPWEMRYKVPMWSERCLHPCRWPYLQMPARWSFIHLTHVGNSSFPMQWDFGPQKPWTSKHTETWHTEVKPKSSSPNSLYMMVLSSVAWHLMRERKPQGIKMYISYKMTLGNQRVCWWFRAKEWHLSERKGMLCSEKAGFHSAGIVITYLVNKW